LQDRNAERASRSIDKEELNNKLTSNWSELDKRGEKLVKEMNDILKDAGATEAQIKWGNQSAYTLLEK